MPASGSILRFRTAILCSRTWMRSAWARGHRLGHPVASAFRPCRRRHLLACGHNGRRGASRPVPTFPKARYVIQQREWDDATGNLPELARAYNERNFLAIQESGQLHLVDGDAAVLPGVSVRLTGGHTRGHQVVIVESRGQRAVYLGDLCPTTAHLRALDHGVRLVSARVAAGQACHPRRNRRPRLAGGLRP